jgi:hypothetical protein
VTGGEPDECDGRADALCERDEADRMRMSAAATAAACAPSEPMTAIPSADAESISASLRPYSGTTGSPRTPDPSSLWSVAHGMKARSSRRNS